MYKRDTFSPITSYIQAYFWGKFKRKKRNKPQMEITKAGAASLVRSYDDFEPYCNWQRDEGNDTLVVHLPEFKKNQLKVQINNFGILTITGERPISETKWSRFSKQIRLSKNCNTSGIDAKFVPGHLYVRMPKTVVSAVTHDQPTTSVDQHTSIENEKPKLETSQDKVLEKPKVDNKDMCNTTSYMFWQETLGRRSRMDKKVAVSFAVALAAMVAFGAYLSYKYRSSHVEN